MRRLSFEGYTKRLLRASRLFKPSARKIKCVFFYLFVFAIVNGIYQKVFVYGFVQSWIEKNCFDETYPKICETLWIGYIQDPFLWHHPISLEEYGIPFSLIFTLLFYIFLRRIQNKGKKHRKTNNG